MKRKKQNTDIEKVLKARHFSSYMSVPVIKLPIGDSGMSLGVIFLGKDVDSPQLLLHEYGHRLQLKNMGFFRYFIKIFIPSLTANILWRKGKLPYDYYGSPWESEADVLGGVVRTKANRPWPEGAASYKNLLKLFR
ncbi:MAG: hypothetical protein IJ017_02420 [Oscillospiraceae bacterium]|nr:hypothetical protein [Oscillospiraceae bacterium]